MNKQKRILVTGASKGIGQAIALELAKQKYDIIAHYNSDEPGIDETLKLIKNSEGSGKKLRFDVSNRKECRSALATEIERHGAFYGIVCNAGIARDAAFPMMSDDDWDSVMSTNLGGFYNVIKPNLMSMIAAKKGRIIVMSSVSGITGNRGQVNYSATKAGLIGATKSLAVELAKRNITVNCVAPGLIDTGMLSEEQIQHAKGLIPMQRIGRPEEVAGLVGFLMSEASSYITRQVISINGGMV